MNGLLTASKADFGRAPTEVRLFVPETESTDGAPEISIVVPALNEQITFGEFVDWCNEGLAKAGVTGEILIIDSSTDMTPAIALSRGARVLRCPKRGLGRAYIDAPIEAAMARLEPNFGLSPKSEMDDHEMYYDKRDLWPLVVQAGFAPSRIHMRYHKFGLNLFTVVRRASEAAGKPQRS